MTKIMIDKLELDVKLPEGAMNLSFHVNAITFTLNGEKYEVKCSKLKPKKS